ncbi:MAG: hypothetical protein DSY80_01555 [Desulfocapsa sp.]|nr:MAG: hypothetical protein DSY80_01555 [Desulfocapsa sp.]
MMKLSFSSDHINFYKQQTKSTDIYDIRYTCTVPAKEYTTTYKKVSNTFHPLTFLQRYTLFSLSLQLHVVSL